MTTAEPTTWLLLPRSMRRALVVATAITFLAGALLYQTNVRVTREPRFARGGDFVGGKKNGLGNLVVTTATPVPLPSGETRSSATLTAPDPNDTGVASFSDRPDFPTLGRYVYKVDGSESTTAFGSRQYPAEMTMTIHRDSSTSTPKLHKDELAYDLYFSEEHKEREVVAFRKNGLFFTFEAGYIVFGPVNRTSEASYEPPMLQIPVPLDQTSEISGTSHAIAPDGSESRTEDWTVKVLGQERLMIMGKPADTWMIEIKRQSEPGSAEQLTRTRTYWLDPLRSLWVKWTESMNGAQDFGPGTFTYTTNYTATLDRIEPL